MRPSFLRASRPAFSSTARCFEIAGSDMAKGRASSPTEEPGACASRARIARRVGSARAANVASRAAELLTIWLTISAGGRLSSVPRRGYWNEKVLVRNTAICPRVLGLSGQ